MCPQVEHTVGVVGVIVGIADKHTQFPAVLEFVLVFFRSFNNALFPKGTQMVDDKWVAAIVHHIRWLVSSLGQCKVIHQGCCVGALSP